VVVDWVSLLEEGPDRELNLPVRPDSDLIAYGRRKLTEGACVGECEGSSGLYAVAGGRCQGLIETDGSGIGVVGMVEYVVGIGMEV